MKKLISILLAAFMLVASLSITCYAEEPQFLYADEDIENLYYDFSYVSTMFETMYGTDTAVAYWKYAHDMEKRSFSSWLIDTSAIILGEYPDKEFYVEVLTNMLAAIEAGAAIQAEDQSQFDNLKGAGDYALDLVDIGTNLIGLQGKIKPLEKAIKTANDALGHTVKTADEFKYYEAIVKSYADSDLFLSAIANNTDNVALRDAANKLRSLSTLLLSERVNIIANAADRELAFTAKNFAADLSFSLLKDLDEYKNDSFVKLCVDYGEKAQNVIGNLIDTTKLAFKLTMLGGDVLFGTTNTFKRHNEMDAMADIADALVKAYKSVTVSPTDTPQNTYSNIYTKCEYYKMLISTHLRGEYLIYQLNYYDAGVLSMLTRWIDTTLKDKANSISNWYEKQTENCQEYYNMITGLFSELFQMPSVVDTSFDLYDGFIVPVEQQTTVPEGYIGVYSFDDLMKIGHSDYHNKTETNSANYILMNEIICPAEYDSLENFYGVIDGNGYTIRNLSKPLFENIYGATIQNLGIEINCIRVENKSIDFGAIAISEKDSSVIDNCFTKGVINITCQSGTFGGLLASADSDYAFTIKNCYNTATIKINTTQGATVGGISGKDAKIGNCFNTGNIQVSSSSSSTNDSIHAGGIQGYLKLDWNNYHIDYIINSCFNTGSISAKTSTYINQVDCGGIIGTCYNDRGILNCYNIGSITNDCAESYPPPDSYGNNFNPKYASGGIIGLAYYSILRNCWNSGENSSKISAGGVCGYINESTLADCYNNGSVSALDSAGGIIGIGETDIDSYEYFNTARCYNTGSVSSSLHCGAIAGNIEDQYLSLDSISDYYKEQMIASCYYLDNIPNATEADSLFSGATKINATQMKDANTFTDFDFVNVWRMKDGDPAPTLRY